MTYDDLAGPSYGPRRLRLGQIPHRCPRSSNYRLGPRYPLLR
jgi:hypothetical protein